MRSGVSLDRLRINFYINPRPYTNLGFMTGVVTPNTGTVLPPVSEERKVYHLIKSKLLDSKPLTFSAHIAVVKMW